MNRNEEFIELINQREDTPVELEYIATKAITRAKKSKRRSFFWKTPVVSFCTVALLFILLVNLFPKVAMAMSNVPILKDLVIAVALDPSLRLAVENDYYQVVGESQTQEDVTVNVEYMILDASHISLFFNVDAPVKECTWHYDFTDGGKRSFPAVISFDTMYEVGKLEELKIDFVDGSEIPNDIVFTVTIIKDEDFQKQREVIVVEDSLSKDYPVATPPVDIDSSKTYTFRFVLHPDSNFTHLIESYPLNKTVEIMGQKILFEKLDIYPLQSRLHLDVDDNNDFLIEDLDIVLKDNKGKIYYDGRFSTLTDTYEVDSVYFDSSYFTKAKELTMYVNGIRLIDKDMIYGEINYADKTITNLPKGVTIDAMDLKDSVLSFTLSAQVDSQTNMSEIISCSYYDTDKNIYNFGSWTTNSDPMKYSSNYKISNYMDHKYLLHWFYAPFQMLDDPIELPIK